MVGFVLIITSEQQCVEVLRSMRAGREEFGGRREEPHGAVEGARGAQAPYAQARPGVGHTGAERDGHGLPGGIAPMSTPPP